MSDPVIVGTEPWLPERLRRIAWLTEPVPAVRLAALRIGTGLALLGDVLVTYVPHMEDRQSWASRGRIFVWAWIPVVLIVFGVVYAWYR